MIDEVREEHALHELIERYFRVSFTTENPVITQAVTKMLAAGGKRLRPRLTLLSVRACGGNPEGALHLAAYMELIHVATLIHDDVVDGAAMRRGVNATAVDFGNRTSVLAGDYLFAWIFKNVTANYPPPIPHVLSATLAAICDGEVLQLHALGNLDVRLHDYVEIARKKTASLFAAAAECGAIVARGDRAQTDALRTFGERYGIAFQMRDDLLDLTAESGSLGKPVHGDLLEHKMTAPLILALEGGDEALRGDVEALFSGAEIPVARVAQAVERQGGAARTKIEIARWVRLAEDALEPLPAGAAKERLSGLARRLVE
ncbi:MAG: polyprenyl synthetase family protein [Candidatus Tyrphobacter sp.]